jgi:hypothetical protein
MASLREAVEPFREGDGHVPFVDHVDRVGRMTVDESALPPGDVREPSDRVSLLGEDLVQYAARRPLGESAPAARSPLPARIHERERSHAADPTRFPQEGRGTFEDVQHVDHQRRVERPPLEREPVSARTDQAADPFSPRPGQHPEREVGSRDLEAAVDERPRDATGSHPDLKDRSDAGAPEAGRDAIHRRRVERVPRGVVDGGDPIEGARDLTIRHRPGASPPDYFGYR